MQKRRPDPEPKSVREPAQAYLGRDDSALLARLAAETGLPKAEIMRRGIRSFARELGGGGPMLSFLAEISVQPWPDEVAVDHDRILAEEYVVQLEKKSAKKPR